MPNMNIYSFMEVRGWKIQWDYVYVHEDCIHLCQCVHVYMNVQFQVFAPSMCSVCTVYKAMMVQY